VEVGKNSNIAMGLCLKVEAMVAFSPH